MNNYDRNQIAFLIICFLALAIFTVTPCEGKVKSRKSIIRFDNNHAKVACVTFQLTDHCITAKQPFQLDVGEFIPHVKNNPMKLVISAGRKKSSGPAKCFNRWVGSYGNIFGKPVSGLNFALKGTLKLYSSATCDEKFLLETFYNMVLGQGQSVLANNWWMGSANCSPSIMDATLFRFTRVLQCGSGSGTSWYFKREPLYPALIVISKS